MSGPMAAALAAFKRRDEARGWIALPFFQDGSAERVAAKVDARIAAGATVLPAPDQAFNGLVLTPLEAVRAVILGQDPYPTPGDAHGLAFSYVGKRRLPASLAVILKEMAAETGAPRTKSGDLTPWARQGVLLLNTALTVEAGEAGAHLKLGWSALADQAVKAVSDARPAVAFLLWGAPARKRAALVDRDKHIVLEAGHPSPLNRLRDFEGSRPFARANEWFRERGLPEIDWRL
ncbi:MAG TPA: uracil-DNA glycosylase [Salinarimonas sp.]|nr:uracil-DNA glycosylase [Salinarimonas sp.]